MQKKGRYNFDLVMRHSNTLALESRRNNKERHHSARKTLSFLGTIIDQIGNEVKSHQRNVRMALSARFYNHLFSQLILTERGLFLDAYNASRSATETTAFYWLVCLDPNSAALYDAEESPRPVEIRKKLEKLDVDISEIKELYKLQCGVSHLGDKSEHMQIQWKSHNNGELMIGGGLDLEIEDMLYSLLPCQAGLFLRHDPTYEVCESDT